VLRGQDSRYLFDRMDGVLRDDGHEVAWARRQPLPLDRQAPAGLTADERLALAEDLLLGPPHHAPGIVWFKLLQARLYHPGMLRLGVLECPGFDGGLVCRTFE
jgi:hypothetical protein